MKLYISTDFPKPLKDYAAQHKIAYKTVARMLEEAGVCPEKDFSEDMISRGEHGKPYLTQYPHIHFNISHCPECVAVVLSDTEVGIDVQQRFEWKESLARYILSKAERKSIDEALSDEEKRNLLNLYWCRKESYLKCTGQGITVNLSDVDVAVKNNELVTEEGRFTFMQVQNERYTLCVCEKQDLI